MWLGPAFATLLFLLLYNMGKVGPGVLVGLGLAGAGLLTVWLSRTATERRELIPILWKISFAMWIVTIGLCLVLLGSLM